MWGALVCAALGALFYLVNNGLPFAPSAYKYPPQCYFLLYGSLISVVLWLFKDRIANFMGFVKLKSFATFIGQNTIWIYLWHIPFVMLFKGAIDNCFIRYIVIYACALVVFKLQALIAMRVDNPNIKKYLLG